MRFWIRVWRTRGVYANIRTFKRVIREGMIRDVAPLVVKAAEARVENWTTPPRLMTLSDVTPRGVWLRVVPLGPGAENWRRVSWGVKGHWISVRKKHTFCRYKKFRPTLRLRRYAPRTLPGGFFGGPGLKYGITAYRRRVWWSGIKPRFFEKDIIKGFRRSYYKILENIVRRAIRAAQREGR